jgi:hypothetical protein
VFLCFCVSVFLICPSITIIIHLFNQNVNIVFIDFGLWLW